MANKFLDIALTPNVRAAQEHYYGRSQRTPRSVQDHDPLGEDEITFIRERDSFYMGSVNAEGWPYVQHRGGSPGFCKIVGPNQLAFADYNGNRQLLSTGNFATNDRVCLFFMDYPGRQRLKLLGHAEVLDAREHPRLVTTLTTPELEKFAERIFRIRIVSFDWNCPKYITPRYSAGEVSNLVAPLKHRIAELEAQLKNQD